MAVKDFWTSMKRQPKIGIGYDPIVAEDAEAGSVAVIERTGRLGDWWDRVTPWDTVNEQKEWEEQWDEMFGNLDLAALLEAAQGQAGDLFGVADPTQYIEGAVGLQDQYQAIQEWLAANGLTMNDIGGETEGMQALIDALAAGPDQQQGREYAASTIGLSADELGAMLNELTTSLAGGVNEAEGFTPEELALRERKNRANLRDAEARAKRLVENSFADTGSTVRMLAQADEATRQISNLQLQQDVQLAQEDFERAMAQFNSQKEMWVQMVQANQMGYADYMDRANEGMGIALQGYMSKINALLAENQQYLQMHQQDQALIAQQIEDLYNAANIQLGVNQAYIDAITQLYAQSLQPFLDQIQIWLLQEDMAPEGLFAFLTGMLGDAMPAIIAAMGGQLPIPAGAEVTPGRAGIGGGGGGIGVEFTP